MTTAAAVRCPDCDFENPTGARFCAGCGRALETRACPRCGATNPATHRFCGACGRRLAAASSAPERRQVTVLFCDLTGSTELANRLPLEQYRRLLLGEYQPRCRHVIERYGGRISRYEGDGIQAHFGYPRAYEDGAARAARAALALVEEVRSLTVDVPGVGERSLSVRIGVDTGPVIAGDTIGEGESEQEPVLGETPNRAKRLQELAQPGAAYVGANTRELAADAFEYRSIGPRALKGLPGEPHVWQVLRERPGTSRFLATHSSALGPLVGREEELELMLRRWRKAVQGAGQVVLIAGEPGIGKSRLLAALRDATRSERRLVLEYQCYQMYEHTPLHPVIAHVERASAAYRARERSERERLLGAWCTRLPEAGADTSRLLSALLGVTAPADERERERSPEELRTEIMVELVRLLGAVARRRPAVVLVEDVHWIDPSSLELLGRLVDAAASLPMLVLVTHRPEFVAPWVGQPHVTALSLRRFTPRESHALVDHLVGAHEVGAGFVDKITSRSDGIPLAIEEITRMMLDVLVGPRAGLEPETRSQALATIPMRLRDPLMARLDRLRAGKRAAQLGSVIGPRFDHELFAAGWRHAYESSEGMAEALGELCSEGVLSRLGEPPHARYTFRHALLRDVAYESLVEQRRARLHGALARAIEGDFPEVAEREPEILARHRSAAGFAREAAASWSAAGALALRRSAYPEASLHLEAGLRELERLPVEERPPLELELRRGLALALLGTNGWAHESVGTNYAHARRLATAIGDDESRFNAIRGSMNYHLIRGDLPLALELADELVRIARTSSNPRMAVAAHRAQGGCCLHAGRFGEAREHLARSLAARLAPEVGRASAFVYGADGTVVALSLGAWADWYLGRVRDADEKIQRAIALSRQVNHPFSEAYAHGLAASVWQCRRRPEEAGAAAKASLAIAHAHGLTFWRARARILLGWCAAVGAGRHDGVVDLRAGIEAYEQTGAGQLLPLAYTLLADAHSSLGQVAAGLDAIERALRLTRERGLVMYEAETSRVRAGLLAAREPGQASAFETALGALATARAQGAVSLALRVACTLHELSPDAQRRDVALAAVRDALLDLRDAGAEVDSRLARALLGAA